MSGVLRGAACVIPALNEEKTVGGVVAAALSSGVFDDVIVVSDGSTDGTAAAAQAAGARVLELGKVLGKGAAMTAGVLTVSAPVVCFLDADLTDLGPEQVKELVAPVLSGGARMSIGVRNAADSRMFRFRKLFLVSGQRAMRRDVFLAVPPVWRRGYRVEKALNFVCRVNRWPVTVVALPGLGTRTKLEKSGFSRGLSRHLAMIAAVSWATISMRLHWKEFIAHDAK